MTLSTDYARPVTVNGFECKNCTEVDYAKKHIDPAHPKSGPYGVNEQSDPTVTNKAKAAKSDSISGPDAAFSLSDRLQSLLAPQSLQQNEASQQNQDPNQIQTSSVQTSSVQTSSVQASSFQAPSFLAASRLDIRV